MTGREHGAGRQSDEVVAPPAGFDPVRGGEAAAPAPKPVRLTPRPDRGKSFDAALDETMRDHHAVFAALAK